MAQDEAKVEPFSNGLEVITIQKGDGQTFPKKSDIVSVKYKGFFHGGPQHNKEFDTCMKEAYKFKVGEEIKGWNKGIKKMSKGEKATLKIPYRLAYGIDGNADYGIPKKQDLLYEIELLQVLSKLSSGVVVNILSKSNSNKSPEKGDFVFISYTGRFYGGMNDGQIFEQTNGKFHEYQIGAGKLIKGWEEGIPQMKYGETAELLISADFAYGKKGAKGIPPIPPNQDLKFTVTLRQKQV